MAIKIYVDILFLTNLIFDFVLLLFTATFTKSFVKPRKLLLASGAGAFLSVISFFCVKNAAITMLTSLITSTLMIILSFGVKDIFACVRLSAVLYVCTFTLGGAILSLVKTDGFVVSGGAFYIDVGITELLFAGVSTYILSNISYGIILNRKMRAELTNKIVIEHNNEKIELRGFFDTGNTLKDTSGRGVLVADEKALTPILKSGNTEFDTIVVKTVGGESVLKAFTPDKVYELGKDKEKQPRRKVAVSKEKISGEHLLILPSDFYD